MMTAMKTIKGFSLFGLAAMLSLSLFACSMRDGKVDDNKGHVTEKATTTATATANATPTDNATDNAMDDMKDDVKDGVRDVKDGMQKAGEGIKDGIGDTAEKVLPDGRQP
jgi:hypothetical protein